MFPFNLLQIFLEQKKMFKTGLNIARFREHVKIIERETIEYFQRWGDSGERSKTPIFATLSPKQLTIKLDTDQIKKTNVCQWTLTCFRPVRGSVRADYPHSQQLPARERDPQHAGWTRGPALRRLGRRIYPRCVAPAGLAAPAQLQVGLPRIFMQYSAASAHRVKTTLDLIWLDRLKKKKKLEKKDSITQAKEIPEGFNMIWYKQHNTVWKYLPLFFLFVCCLGRGTELTERSRTSSTKWFRNGGALKRKQMTSCRPSWTPHTSKVTSAAQNKR